MTTHPASRLVEALARALHESCSRQDIDGYLAAKIDCKVLAQAAVAALAAEAAPQVPADGWVLVPREPTQAMLKAGFHALLCDARSGPVWSAMLAAAPDQEGPADA